MKFFSKIKSNIQKEDPSKQSIASDELSSLRDSTESDLQVPVDESVPFQDFVNIDIRLKINDSEARLFHRTRYNIEIQSEGFPTKCVQKKSSDFEGLHQIAQLLFPNVDLPEFPRKMSVLSKKKRIESYESLLMKLVEESNKAPSQQLRVKIRRILYNFLYSIHTQIEEEPLSRSQSNQESSQIQSEQSQASSSELKDQVEYYEADNELISLRQERRSKSYFLNDSTADTELISDRNQSFQGLHVVKQGKGDNPSNQVEINQKQEQQVKNQLDHFHKLDQKEKSGVGSYLQILHRKDSLSDEIRKEGYFYLNIVGIKQLKKYFLKICSQNILIYSLNSQNQFEYCIPCNSLQVMRGLDKDQDTIFIGHRYDKYQIAIKHVDEQKEKKAQSQINEEIIRTYQEIKHCVENCNKGTKQKPTGKIIMELKEASLPKNSKTENSTFHIVIKHMDVKVLFYKKQAQENVVINWGQKVMLPIFDNYSEIEIELYRTYTSGMLMATSKEELIGTQVIRIADILYNIYQYNSFFLETQLNSSQKQGQTNNANNQAVAEDLKIKVVFKISDFTQKMSYFARNYEEKYENQILSKDKYTQKERLEFKVTRNRIKVMRSNLIFKLNNFSEILNFKYPRVSWIFYIFMILFALQFNMNYLFIYLMLFLILTTLYCHSEFRSQVYEKFQKSIEYLIHQNEDYFPQKIQTFKEFELQKMTDINQITIIQMEGIFSKVKKYKKYLGYLTYLMFHLISFVEKLKNLICWYHYQKTYIFLIYASLSIFLYLVIPFNLVFAALTIKRLLKGMKFYKIVKKHNQRLIRLFVQEIVKKFFPEFSDNIKHPDKEWPQNCYTFLSLNKKMVEQVTQLFKFKVKDDLLIQYKSMNDLCNYLTSTHEIIYLPKSVLVKDFQNIQDKEKFIKKKPLIIKVFSHIYYFIYNIPSDYYRVIYPQQY
ncbi:transmembrane protein, putative (macronuclear) [Tetrahymena thermophila SB210]|uniref:Transmembrane protein, putative n=1 Tax=Tetrahymena thermophila (strain SB210) TaxID=312017 RepID=I7MGR6_TETTS|nr:transmembrane protein, putative [Tetrahymena thermophila SB210]EAR85425.2 transmembrane protein, putative [Tetrahymena thermophila SB210]|eukprot:XP_001033088.2 transmembrane protein, putative [Tetrahymena thermophila SB210]